MRLTTVRILGNVVLAATVLRAHGLGAHSLWLDEGATWSFATRPTAADTAVADTNHPPVWWLATRLALRILPEDEIGLRAPAALLGVVSVLLAWALARRLLDPARVPSRGGFVGLDRGAPVWVAVLAAASPFWVELSQEARMYAALLAESLGLSLLYLRWLDRGGRGALLGYAVLGAVAMHTHYYAVWVLVGHAAHAVVADRTNRFGVTPRRRLPFLAASGVAVLSIVPWFLLARETMTTFDPPRLLDVPGHLAHAFWRMGVGPGLVVLDRARLEVPIAQTLAEEALVVAVVALLWFVPIGFGIAALRRDRGLRSWVAATVGVPVLLLLAASRHVPLTQERYVVAQSAPLLLLAVLGARSAPRVLRPVLLGGLLLLSVAGLFAQRFPGTRLSLALTHGHPYGKEQWREARAWVAERGTARDPVFLHSPYVRLVWDFYDRGARPRPLLPRSALAAEALLERYPQLATADRAFLVLSHEETEDRDHYANAIREAWFRASLERGAPVRMETRAFPRQWGVRVFEFARESDR